MAVVLEARKAVSVVQQHKRVQPLRDEVEPDSLAAKMVVVDMVDLTKFSR